MDLEALILRACAAREPLIRSGRAQACRLFHGAADGVGGLVVERWGDVLTVQLHCGQLHVREDRVQAAMEGLRQQLGARAVYRKVFPADRAQVAPEIGAMHMSSQPWLGVPVEEEVPIVENELRFLVRPYDGFSVGLFLEHRENRRRIRTLAEGRRVLNLFSYTCGFSVAAAAGGASSVASVDLSRRYLEWGKRNFEINSLSIDGHLFFCSDVLDFYERAERQGRRFDLVILDAPTFARMRRPKRALVLEQDLGRLLGGALQLLDPGGILLLATNARQISLQRMEREICMAAGPRSCTTLECPSLPPDFPDDPEYSKTMIVQVQ